METKRKIAELVVVAEELNNVCGCDPAIKIPKKSKTGKFSVKQKETLIAEIIEGSECIELDVDNFTEETTLILQEMECWPGDEKAEEPEKDEKAEEPEKDETLEDKLKKSRKMVDLQVLLEEYPAEFKKAKNAIAAANNPIKLKKAMGDALGIVPTEKSANNKPKVTKGPGVISTIVECISSAGKKGVDKADILDILVETFPERKADAMKKTINVQVPNRISKERFEVSTTKDGKYFKA